jgi:fatty acid desaturase (delta-4 desaturase)
MAPNADQTRLRNRFGNKDTDNDALNTTGDAPTTLTATTDPNKRYLNDLGDKEIAIDGAIYDMEDFASRHPGGTSILLFGGNDVTVQYKMIHPYHTSKHLEKMKRVGTVVDWKADYLFDTEFERDIKREVFKIVRRGREFGTPGYFARAFCYISLMVVCQYLWVTQGSSWPMAVILGVAQALIGLNVQHDANHGAASKNHWVNDVLGFGADFIGGCKWLWMEQHWTHHAYTNHSIRDPDAVGAEPALLFNDYPLGHPARKFYHKYQAWLYLPALSFYWLSAVFNTEVITLKQGGSTKIAGMKFDNAFVQDRRKYAVAIRCLYIYWNVVTPFQHHGLTLTPLLQILFMGAMESLTLAILFSLSHNFENADRDPTGVHKKNKDPVCWFKSQVETSSTYGSFISGALTGGLNFQVEHHLFPRMSSAWYPFIAPTVREVCKKHGVRYAYYPYLHQNLISTLKYMRQAGTGENWEVNPLSGNA